MAVHDRARRSSTLWVVGFVYLLLSFPSGRLRGRLDRWLMVVGRSVGCSACSCWRCCTATRRGCAARAARTTCCRWSTTTARREAWLSLRAPDRRRADRDRDRGGSSGAGCGRARRSGAPWRRCWWRDAPRSPRSSGRSSSTCSATRWARFPRPSGSTRRATVPIAVLYVFLQRRLARGMVAGLVVELGGPSASADLREALARALGDPSLAARVLVPGREVLRRRRRHARSSSRTRTAARRLDVRRARRTADRGAAARPGAGAQRRARALRVRRREPGARERAPPGRAPRPAGRAAGVAGAAGRGDRRRAAADRARPPRRHPAAARLDRDVARPARVKAAGPRRRRPSRSCARRARRWRSRSRSCAS